MRTRVLVLLLVGIAVAYVLVLALVWSQQDQLVFPAAGRPARPIDVPGAEVQWRVGLDDKRFRTARLVPPEPRAVLAFFVGNGEDLTSGARRAAELAGHGVAVLTAEYPGYGASEGPPSVAALLRCAEVVAADAEALARERGLPFVVGGSSLGSFCALHVAAAGRAERCLLCAPPTTLADAAAERFWWLPVGLLLRHRFDNVATAAAVRCPVLLVHGDRDVVVPLSHGQRLRDLLGERAELIVVPGRGHNDLSLGVDGPVGAAVSAFLRGR